SVSAQRCDPDWGAHPAPVWSNVGMCPLGVPLTEAMSLRLRLFVSAACSLAALFAAPAHATMTADVNCRAWGARYDAPALLERMLDRQPAQNRELAHRVCERKVSARTMNIIGQVPRAKAHATQVTTVDASFAQ